MLLPMLLRTGMAKIANAFQKRNLELQLKRIPRHIYIVLDPIRLIQKFSESAFTSLRNARGCLIPVGISYVSQSKINNSTNVNSMLQQCNVLLVVLMKY